MRAFKCIRLSLDFFGFALALPSVCVLVIRLLLCYQAWSAHGCNYHRSADGQKHSHGAGQLLVQEMWVLRIFLPVYVLWPWVMSYESLGWMPCILLGTPQKDAPLCFSLFNTGLKISFHNCHQSNLSPSRLPCLSMPLSPCLWIKDKQT